MAYNYLVNRMFTSTMFDDFIHGKTTDAYQSLVRKVVADPCGRTNRELIEIFYQYMNHHYRSEYFYQNSLFTKILLGRHSLKTTSALIQIPVANSRTDLILINGEAVVYEIKTELDNFDKLDHQLKDYYKAFDHICVVIPEGRYYQLFQELEYTPVGIYAMTEQGTFSHSSRKEPVKERRYLNHYNIFHALRKNEYEAVILSYYGCLPNVKPAFYYETCYHMFDNIPIDEAYDSAIMQLKRRNLMNLRNSMNAIPLPLKSLAYFNNPNRKELNNLEMFLNTVYQGG